MGEETTCCGQCARLMLFLFNFVFWICGLGLLGAGLYLVLDPTMNGLTKFLSLDEDNPLLHYAAYVLMGVGGFAILVGIFGCCGAVKLSRCLLCLYAALVMIAIAGEIAGSVLAAIKQQDIKDMLEVKARKFMYKDYTNQTADANEYVQVVDLVQTYFRCCGVDNFQEYKASNLYNKTGISVPWSCCERNTESRYKPSNDLKKEDVKTCWKVIPSKAIANWAVELGSIEIYGCKKGLGQWFQDHAVILYGVGFGVAGLEIFVVIFACCLMCRIRDD